MFVQIVLILLVLYFAHRMKNRRIYELSRKLNNDVFTVPFIGHLYLFRDRMAALCFFGRKALKNGGLAAMWLGPQFFTVVADPIAAEFLMKSCLEKDNIITNVVQCLTGNGSVFAPVSIWHRRRKILSTNFSSAKLNHFVNYVFSHQSQIMIDKLKAVAGTGPVSMWSYLTAYSLDSVCESIMGIDINSQGNSDHPFQKTFEEYCKLIVDMIFKPYIHQTRFSKLTKDYAALMKHSTFIRDFVKKIIQSKHQQREDRQRSSTVKTEEDADNKKLISFLDIMITKTPGNQKLSDLELLEELLVLIVAGTDTSATGSAFAAMMLSRHPQVQEKVFQELQEVIGDSNRPIHAKDLNQLKYLEAVIRETLRLYPPVPIVVRKIEEDVTIPSGLTLVKGTSLVINIWATNRNQNFWGVDAEEIRPERFIDAPIQHPAAFMSFSTGPRSCLGYKYAMMSMKIVAINLIRNFRILPANPSDIEPYVNTGKCIEKEKPLRTEFGIMMKDVDNFMVQLKPR